MAAHFSQLYDLSTPSQVHGTFAYQLRRPNLPPFSNTPPNIQPIILPFLVSILVLNLNLPLQLLPNPLLHLPSPILSWPSPSNILHNLSTQHPIPVSICRSLSWGSSRFRSTWNRLDCNFTSRVQSSVSDCRSDDVETIFVFDAIQAFLDGVWFCRGAEGEGYGGDVDLGKEGKIRGTWRGRWK